MTTGKVACYRCGNTSRVKVEIRLSKEGDFALGYPRMTVGGFFMLHLVFGLLVGLVYGALV